MRAVTATLAMGANLLYYANAKDYFQQDHSEEPLLHCWSLAVEEQFYLVHPILLLILWRCTKSTKVVFVGLAVLAIASFAMSVVFSKTSQTFAYYMLPTRAWEMALGGFLAFDHGPSIFDNRRWLAEAASVGGVAMIVASCFVFTAATPWPSYHALLPCMGTVFFVWSQRPALTTCGKFFAHKVPVFVGQLSYSWYLWHWPVYVLLAYTSLTGSLGPGEKVGGVIGSFAIGVVSFKFVEPTFRSKTNRWASNTLFAAVVAVVWIILISFSTAVWKSSVGGIRVDTPLARGPTPFFTDSLFVADPATGATCWKEVSLKADNYSVLDRDTLLASRDFFESGTPKYTSQSSNDFFYIQPNDAVDAPSVVVIGSSIAAQYSPLLERLAIDYNTTIAFLLKGGIGGSFGMTEAEAEPGAYVHSLGKGLGFERYVKYLHHPDWDAARLARLEEWKPAVVVWADQWEMHADLTPELMQSNFRDSLAVLSKHATRIVVVGSHPTIHPTFGTGVGGFNSLSRLIVNVDRKYDGRFEALEMLQEKLPGRRRRVEQDIHAAIAAETAANANVAEITFVPVVHFYLRDDGDTDTDYIRLIDPYSHQMWYSDPSHLNTDGTRMAEGAFRKTIFGEPPCEL